MSELPAIDPLKVAKREAEKLRTQVAEASYRETQLEILAEALRDNWHEALKELEELKEKFENLSKTETPVADISSLP